MYTEGSNASHCRPHSAGLSCDYSFRCNLSVIPFRRSLPFQGLKYYNFRFFNLKKRPS